MVLVTSKSSGSTVYPWWGLAACVASEVLGFWVLACPLWFWILMWPLGFQVSGFPSTGLASSRVVSSAGVWVRICSQREGVLLGTEVPST